MTMQRYLPEGMRLATPENREACASLSSLERAMNTGMILEGMATMCDHSLCLHVDVGGFEGLIPAREVAWERVDDLNRVLKSGDAVTVKVMRIDRDEGKVSLSRRECMARVFKRSPEDEAAAKSAAEVAEWMEENSRRNANVGSMSSAFDGLKL